MSNLERDSDAYAQEQYNLTQLFEAWAENHLGQGYPLTKDEGTYEHAVTRWAFVAYKAGRKEAAIERVHKGRLFMQEIYCVMLWLYRRLPRAYANPPHVDVIIKRLGAAVGENPDEFLAERGYK